MSYPGLPYLGKPHEWIAKDGLPAAIVGDPTKSKIAGHGGLPTLETDDGFQVYENIFVTMGRGGNYFLHQVRATPFRYDKMAASSERGCVAGHDGEDAPQIYRPCIYRLHLEATYDGMGVICWERQGSQRELFWRHGLHEGMEIARKYKDDPIRLHFLREVALMREERAERKAERLLDSMLTDSQAYEWRVCGRFRCYGAVTGNVYEVQKCNGFAAVDPHTNEQIVSYCFHPECWMPDADVALATKLHLEDPELEEDFVSGANANVKNPRPAATPELQRQWEYATGMERELIA